MSIYDPCGYLGNFMIFTKLLMPAVWKSIIGWDEPVPHELFTRWKSWFKEFENIKGFPTPRCYSQHLFKADNIQLHVFVDASSNVGVAYLRVEYCGAVDIAFVSAKTRCITKSMSIPRLELQAAVLGCRLSVAIATAHDLRLSETLY